MDATEAKVLALALADGAGLPLAIDGADLLELTSRLQEGNPGIVHDMLVDLIPHVGEDSIEELTSRICDVDDYPAPTGNALAVLRDFLSCARKDRLDFLSCAVRSWDVDGHALALNNSAGSLTLGILAPGDMLIRNVASFMDWTYSVKLTFTGDATGKVDLLRDGPDGTERAEGWTVPLLGTTGEERAQIIASPDASQQRDASATRSVWFGWTYCHPTSANARILADLLSCMPTAWPEVYHDVAPC